MANKVNLEDAALFGASDARNPIELEGLRKYFVSLPGFGNVLGGRQTIVAGRKGTGKTAIRSHLLSLWDSVVHVDVEPLLASHSLFAIIGRSVEGNESVSYASYEYAWRSYVLASVLRKLVQDNLLGFGDRTAVAKYIKRIQGHKPVALQERVTEIASSFDGLIGTSAKIDTEFVRRALPSELEMSPLLTMVGNAAHAHDKRIIVLVDRVDQQLEHTLLSGLWDKYRKYVGGLCLAAARIASSVDRHRLSFYAFVRDDVLGEVLPHLHNATEFRDLVYRLPWRNDQLMDLLGTRLAAALDEDYSAQRPYEDKRQRFFSSDLFHAVFERHKLDGYPPWTYFLLHTHMRPRDLINVCNAARQEAIASQKSLIDGNAINRGMWSNSHAMYGDLIASHRYMVSDFQRIIDSFRQGPLSFSRGELVAKLQLLTGGQEFLDATQGDERLDAEGAIRVLYKSGFLVAPIQEDGGGLPFVASHADPNRATDTEQQWIIHPTYFREMRNGMDPPNVRSILGNKPRRRRP